MKRLSTAFLCLLTIGGTFIRADDKQPLVPSITVTGSGKATAVPDMAEVQIGVIAQADTAAKALKENSASMDKLFQMLEARGIAKKDVQTSNFNVQPQYKQTKPGQRQEIVGYQVSNQVRVKVRKLDALGALLDAAVGEGANQVNGVSFSVAAPDPLLDEARVKAIADARRKAELYAKAAGTQVGQVLLIQEETPRLPVPLFRGMMAGEARAAVPIAEGEQEFHASITVTFAIAQ